LAATAALILALCGSSVARGMDGAEAPPADSLGPQDASEERTLVEVLRGYNAGIRRAMDRIDTLRVAQEMIEPTEDGGEKRAEAVLHYGRDEGMVREELYSDLGHPVGEYALSSLVGPQIVAEEYEVRLDGIEEMEGRVCHRLAVSAIERDRDHFDGTVWIEVETLGLVRIVAEVADAPFPVKKVRLDKAFEPFGDGLHLLRRHTGEVEIQLAFVNRRGVMHIFYSDYAVRLSP
jgi:hypothetical protein